MDIISLSKANKALRDITHLDDKVVAPLAESRFMTVDARLDWIESQASKAKVEIVAQVDLSKKTFNDTEFKDGKVQLEVVSSARGQSNEDVALGKPTKASGSYSGSGPEKVVDGNVSSIWNAGSTSASHWWRVDLGEEYEIYKFGFRSNEMTQFSLYGSHDDVNYDLLGTWTGVSTTQVTQFELIPHATYRYFKIANMAGGNYWKTIGHFEAFPIVDVDAYASEGSYESNILDLTGIFEYTDVEVVKSISYRTIKDSIPNAMTANTSEGVTVSASSIYATSTEPWKAFNKSNIDGNDGWHSLGTGGPHWIQIDYGSKPKIIVEYDLSARQFSGWPNHIKTWNIQGSHDASSWVDLDSRVNETFTPAQKKTYSFDNEIAYRYYRIYITLSDSAYATIGELVLRETNIETQVDLFVSTSQDGVNFSDYIPFDEANPPVANYLKFKALLTSIGVAETEGYVYDQTEAATTVILNEFSKSEDTKLKLETEYQKEFTVHPYHPDLQGTVLGFTIDRSQFKSIDKLEVE